jgi:hypothetical protein
MNSIQGILGINPVAGTEQPRNGGFIASEQRPGMRSRDQVTLNVLSDSASNYIAGVVLGKESIGTKAAFANSAGDTGTGTCGTITLSAGVQEGVYTGQFVTAGVTAQYQLEAPNGTPLLNGKVGTAFSNGGLAFTLTTGGTAYAIGDEFTITVGTAAFANGGADTGNGTCSAIVVDPGVEGGIYTFTCTAGGATAVFSGVDPSGLVLPGLTVGTAYNGGGLTFTVSAGGTAYVIGDTFTVTTYTGSGNYDPVSASGINGSQNAVGILIYQQYVGGATPLQVGIVSRAAEVNAALLVWPSTATDDQIRNWTAQLAALGIIARTGQV